MVDWPPSRGGKLALERAQAHTSVADNPVRADQPANFEQSIQSENSAHFSTKVGGNDGDFSAYASFAGLKLATMRGHKKKLRGMGGLIASAPQRARASMPARAMTTADAITALEMPQKDFGRARRKKFAEGGGQQGDQAAIVAVVGSRMGTSHARRARRHSPRLRARARSRES